MIAAIVNRAHGRQLSSPQHDNIGVLDSAPMDHGLVSQTCQSLPKIGPLRGSLHVEWKRCGKASCRCAGGALHGPFFYRHERREGCQHKIYVPAAQVEQVRAGLTEWRRLHPPARSTRMMLTELRRLLRIVDGIRGD
jgi:hypothetical protein